jgi:repressor LexA
VHRHVTLLQERGILKRRRSRRRSIELRPVARRTPAVDLPLLGAIAAGRPIEALVEEERAALPRELVRRPEETFVLRVRGDSMRDEQILDGDLIVVERRERAENGDVVVALIEGREATLKTFYRERGRIRLQPANPAMEPITVDPEAVRIQGIVTGLFRRFE